MAQRFRHLRSFCIALTAAVVIFEPGSASQELERPTLRGRIATPVPAGVLGEIRTSAPQPIEIDATGVELTLPEVWDVDPKTGAQYRLGEIIVKFREGTSDAVRTQSLLRSGAETRSESLAGKWRRVGVDATTEQQAVAVLQADPAVEHASLNYRSTTFQHRPNDEFYSLQWNFDAIDLPRAWELNPGARSEIVVAIVDTGLNFESSDILFRGPVGQFVVRFGAVPDLVADGRIVDPYDFVYDDDLPFDLGGHGTHVAGTVAQETDNSFGVAGVAYKVRLMPVKVISGGSFISWDDIFYPGNKSGANDVVASGIRYAADRGAKVINLSLGGPGPAPMVQDAVQYAVDRGAFVAMSAGNSAQSGNPINYPAAYAEHIEGAMAVGAVNRLGRRANYSSYRDYVEICAPGGQTIGAVDFDGGVTQVTYDDDWTLRNSTVFQKLLLLSFGFRPRFDRFELVPLQGTSMASPHVAGVAALLYAQGITDPRAIEEAIKQFARPIDATADECGAGLIDPRRTLRGLGLGS